ncbi:MAG: DUF2061 domain-containing protein [Rhizobiales bacterium]|nr:DUF2061 domain-containing protein [Hyphomicrobiales bacterium]
MPEKRHDPLITKAITMRRRSIAKTLSWRVLASLDTFLLSWLITGSFVFAGSIASAEVVTKMALYYFHERSWDSIRWGLRH